MLPYLSDALIHCTHLFVSSLARGRQRYPLIVPLLALAVACQGGSSGGGDDPAPHMMRLLGGAATVFDDSINAYSLPPDQIPTEDSRSFFRGRALFRDPWVIAPASTQTRDGLGPVFNGRSCEACHVRDGRGRPPLDNEPAFTTMLVRISIPGVAADGGPLAVPGYGDQIQNFSIPDVPAEAQPRVTYEEVPGTYGDGTPYTLKKPTYTLAAPAHGAFPSDLLMSPRVAPSMIGLGLLQALPEAEVRAGADPQDADGDGISGRVNEVFDVEAGKSALGRFGWKANKPHIRQQTAGAFLGDIGVTSSLFPSGECASGQSACEDAVSGGSPELLDAILDDVAMYAALLAVPAARTAEGARFAAGFERFKEAGCDSCHRPQWLTGTSDVSAVFDHQTIFPFTDLLLHDMGEGLADGRPDYGADGREWRTPPLWGLGLLKAVNGHQRLLHDGRADGFAEAVLWHGGEGEAAREKFRQMPAAAREDLIYFLESI